MQRLWRLSLFEKLHVCVCVWCDFVFLLFMLSDSFIWIPLSYFRCKPSCVRHREHNSKGNCLHLEFLINTLDNRWVTADPWSVWTCFRPKICTGTLRECGALYFIIDPSGRAMQWSESWAEMVEFFQLEIMCSFIPELLLLYGNLPLLKWTWGSHSHNGLILAKF